MPRKALYPLLLVGALFFLFANRQAYRSYFHPDDCGALGQVLTTSAAGDLRDLVSLEVRESNPRPLGRLFYRVMNAVAGLRFEAWVATIHLLHFLVAALVCVLLIQLGVAPLGVAAGALLFLFHSALLNVYWRPSAAYDLLAALLGLSSLLAYVRGRWILSFVLFLPAMKAKEVACMLPFVLAYYEARFGGQQWRKLVPFFAAAFWLGLQAAVVWEDKDESYSLAVGPQTLPQTVVFYVRHLLKTPILGLAILAFFWSRKDPRLRFGLAAMGFLMIPMLALPQRMSGAFLYVPLIAFSIAVAVAAERLRPAYVALFFVVWWMWGYLQIRPYRSREMRAAAESRSFLTTLASHARANPSDRAYVYQALPAGFSHAAMEGAVRFACRRGDTEVSFLDLSKTSPDVWSKPVTFLGWDLWEKKLYIVRRDPSKPYPSMIRLDGSTPVWALGEGWRQPEPRFRWTLAKATATLDRPANARAFRITLNIGPDQLKSRGGAGVKVFLGEELIGEAEFREEGWMTAEWKLKPSPPGPVIVRLETPERYQVPRSGLPPLGVAVMEFGFTTE